MPLYEYACRGCGAQVERMGRVAERLVGPDCPTCGLPMALTMSSPGMVGAGGSGGAGDPASWGGSCDTGGCCGGGACGPGPN